MSGALSTNQLLGLIGFPMLLAAGQILFKLAAQQIALDQGLWLLVRSLLTWPFFFALVIYASATLLWVLLLTSIPLARAYPFAALSFAVVPIASMLLFGEQLGVRYFIGIILLFAGLVLIASEGTH